MARPQTRGTRELSSTKLISQTVLREWLAFAQPARFNRFVGYAGHKVQLFKLLPACGRRHIYDAGYKIGRLIA